MNLSPSLTDTILWLLELFNSHHQIHQFTLIYYLPMPPVTSVQGLVFYKYLCFPFLFSRLRTHAYILYTHGNDDPLLRELNRTSKTNNNDSLEFKICSRDSMKSADDDPPVIYWNIWASAFSPNSTHCIQVRWWRIGLNFPKC